VSPDRRLLSLIGVWVLAAVFVAVALEWGAAAGELMFPGWQAAPGLSGGGFFPNFNFSSNKYSSLSSLGSRNSYFLNLRFANLSVSFGILISFSAPSTSSG
jgi:hypothetical protein